MSDGEREIILTLQKIFNWQFPPQSTQLTLAFHSLKTSALILQRTLTATPANAQLTLNYSLKITYLPQENEVVLKLTHLAGRNGSVALAEIAINLDSLTSRKVQFFPLGSNDKVLKIVVGQSQQSSRCPLHGFTRVSSNENQTFLKEKQDFLQRVMKGVSTSSFKNVQSRSQKKSFSQRAKELLGEVQGMKGESQRGRKREEGKGIEQEFNDYYYQNPAAYHTQQELMITSKHQASKLTFTRSESEHRLNPRNKLMGRENDSQRSSNKSQKHRLKLNNLEMVAVENQYYDELPEVRKLKRRSELFQQNYYYSKQKLQRHSQYY